MPNLLEIANINFQSCTSPVLSFSKTWYFMDLKK